MSNTTTAASEKIMDRVAALLRIAEHPNTPAPEAEVALRQANSLITKHAIDEAILRQSQTIGEKRAIVHRTIILGGGEFRPYLRTIFEVAAETLRVSVASKGVRTETGYDTEYHLYGADEDVAWLDMLFGMIKLQFLLKLDPKWDNALGYDANVYNHKVAGFKWSDIDRIAIRNGHPRRESTKLIDRLDREGAREYWERRMQFRSNLVVNEERGEVREYNGFFHALKAAYVRHAKAIGDDTRVKTQSHQAYRLSFAESFRSTMSERFWQMEEDAKREYDSIPGAALAIRDVRDEADRAMWADFPNLSPEEIEKRRQAWLDQQAAVVKAREEMLAKMTPRERQAFLEAEEAKARKDAKAQRAWEKKNTKFYTYDSTARAQGRAAANSVDLTRKAGSAGRATSRGELG